MKTLATTTFVACASFFAWPLSPGRAGADVEPSRRSASAAAEEFDAYLDGQRVSHSIAVAEAKDSATGPVTVRIYDELGSRREAAICAAMSAAAKRTGAATSTVQFFAREPGGSAMGFQASRLPSGTGDVSFNRQAGTPVYKLKRSVRL